jgi:hypothetical protein
MRRLEAAGLLVAENDLAIAYEHNMLCKYLLGTDTHEEFVKIREESRMQWKQMSTFSLRLYGLVEKIGIDQSLQAELDDREYDYFARCLRKNRFNLRLFLRQENYYLTAAKDQIYTNGPMMVKVPMWARVTKLGRRYWFEQTKDSQDLSETKEEFQSLLDWVVMDNRPSAPPSLELLEDDPFIKRKVASASSDEAFAIVTNDVALCREIAAETHIWVCRIPVKWYYMDLYFGEANEPWLEKLNHIYDLYKWSTILDTGSIKSYEEIGFRDGSPIQWPQTRPFSMTARSYHAGRRIRARPSDVPLEENFEWEPYRFPDGYVFTYSNFLRKRRHPYRRGWA